ncbi:phytanoyl-CoA dioxygenase [Gammaproteobacteria bacterium LSUCC0112]|nr:phytanoyl-CoA dioxygenase [Gammaproteobacteria bacterium LSUCC0112]
MIKQLDQNVFTHAILEVNGSSGNLALQLAELKTKGFTIVKSGMCHKLADGLREKIDAIYKLQADEVGGEENLKAMNDANIARALAAYDDAFIDIAALPILSDIYMAVFGSNYTLMSQNGIINVPSTNHYQFTWHRDLNYQHYTSSRPLALSALVCIDPFNEITGGTYVLQGSHRDEAFPSKNYVLANQQVITAEIGDIIVFDSMLFHRTGANTSNMVRRGINHIVTQPFIKQQYNFPYMLGPREDITDPKVRTLLGYGFEPALDVKSWRKMKLEKVGINVD